MTEKALTLDRSELASFLKTPAQIKQFEQLFRIINEVNPASDTPGIEQLAGSALANSNKALALIKELAQSMAVSMALNGSDRLLPVLNELSKNIQAAQLLPLHKPAKRTRYGSFYDTTTQVAAVVNTPQAVTFDATDLSRGVYLGSPASRVYVDTPGVYNFQLSVQLDKITGGSAIFYIWFRKNGVDVANSASQIRVQGNNAEVFSALNYFFDLAANDYIEIMFSVTDLSIQLLAAPAASPVPSIPSIILTVSDNIRG